MRTKDKNDCIFCLVEKDMKIKDLDANYLNSYLKEGYSSYLCAETAEVGRRRGDAYDEPGRTRVVGFKIIPFLPPKQGENK